MVLDENGPDGFPEDLDIQPCRHRINVFEVIIDAVLQRNVTASVDLRKACKTGFYGKPAELLFCQYLDLNRWSLSLIRCSVGFAALR